MTKANKQSGIIQVSFPTLNVVKLEIFFGVIRELLSECAEEKSFGASKWNGYAATP
jgi:hypothetical protein